ncbi:MAG TPA: THUMP domain-containing protein, partial [Lacipirellulaceae bacterium]|nr:THUMP domain-containing protein [Lacipirellulaceae bacterium]
MTTLRIAVTCAFGLEAVVRRELHALGYEGSVARPGRLVFDGDAASVCRANLWLRSADRVLIELAAFPAADFDALFETVRALPWEDWVAPEAAIPVRGRSIKSQLSSVPACQRTVKKAIVERLLAHTPGGELPETGPPVPVEASLVDDVATIDLDTSGAGLHKRGYRRLAAAAQLRETLAAAMVQLSFWQPDRPLVDPFCGSGTIAIEAAQIGRRLAPGGHRTFAAEAWSALPASLWQQARDECRDLALPALPQRIVAQDADEAALKLARYHAGLAEVEQDIHFQRREFAELSSSRHYGCVLANPPYGMRMGRDDEVIGLYRQFPTVLRRLKTWSHFILSARPDLEELVGQQADRRRKLYNGRIACTLYQFFGPRPPRGESPSDGHTVTGEAMGEEVPNEPSDAATAAPRPRVARAEVVKPAFGGLRSEASRQAQEFANRLQKLARHLRRWPAKRGITCYRIYDRDIPEIPLAIDRYEE